MSHPGIIIQTVTSEDLSDPLGQSELVGEQELEKEEPSENHNNSGEEEQSEERSKDVQEEEKVSFSESITKMSVLMLPSCMKFSFLCLDSPLSWSWGNCREFWDGWRSRAHGSVSE